MGAKSPHVASSCSKRWGHLLRQPSRWGILEYLFSFAFAEVVRFSGAALKESVLQQVLVEPVDLVNAIRLCTRRCPRVEAPRRLQGSLRLPVRRYAALFVALLAAQWPWSVAFLRPCQQRAVRAVLWRASAMPC